VSRNDSDPSDLSAVATSTLTRLRAAIADDRVQAPITRASLLDHGIHTQFEALEGALCGHTALACLSVIDVVLAERKANTQSAPELVWSGPERAHATARNTAVVLRALFEQSRRQVILAGYDFTHGSSLLEPLWLAMRDRGVEVHFFIHIEQAVEALSDEVSYGTAKVRGILQQAWPFGEPRPRVYYDVRALQPRPYFNMHAKCVVVDGESALITSANFTRRAYEQNTECGVLLQDEVFAHHLSRQWLGLIEARLMTEACL
jgi:phosphatidylserine/phosphatidylglycerophosphate/cardiolipin synthase-like enzyme